MSKDFVCASTKSVLVVGAWLALSLGTAMAGVVVMDTSVAGLQRGQELSDEQQLDIQGGDHLLVGVVQNGQLKQVDIRGPRHGRVKELLNPEPVSTSLWQMVVRLLKTGGASQGGIAASRGVRVTFNDLPIHGDVPFCLEEGSVPRLALATGSDSESTSLRLSDNQGTQATMIKLPPGQSVAWPTGMPLKDGGVYRIMEASNPQIEVKVRMVPKGSLQDPTSLSALETLVSHGCELQAGAVALRKTLPQQ
jgi:hypothetical protein